MRLLGLMSQRYNFATNGVSMSYYWSFKITSPVVGDKRGAVTRDYLQTVQAGYIPKDPSSLNATVCKPYM